MRTPLAIALALTLALTPLFTSANASAAPQDPGNSQDAPQYPSQDYPQQPQGNPPADNSQVQGNPAPDNSQPPPAMAAPTAPTGSMSRTGTSACAPSPITPRSSK